MGSLMFSLRYNCKRCDTYVCENKDFVRGRTLCMQCFKELGTTQEDQSCH